jgi:hypothetical protein
MNDANRLTASSTPLSELNITRNLRFFLAFSKERGSCGHVLYAVAGRTQCVSREHYSFEDWSDIVTRRSKTFFSSDLPELCDE